MKLLVCPRSSRLNTALIAFTAVAVLATTMWMQAQVEGALVTRRGAVIKGTIEGPFVALSEAADVTIERGASVIGDVLLPAAKLKSKAGGLAKGQMEKSTQTKVAVADASALKGKERVFAGFTLPGTEKPQKPAGTEAAVLQTEKGSDPDFKKIKDLTVKNKKRDVTLPPGNYGNLAVESGRVFLGLKNAEGPPPRYSFESLSVGVEASVELLGPVVVVVGQIGGLQGKIGSDRYTNWLDLRVSTGAILLGPDSEMHGVVTATESDVTMGMRAKVKGGLVCDRATMETASRFTGVQPSWSKESSGNSLPRFIYKAARVEGVLREVTARHAEYYRLQVDYPGDEPAMFVELRDRPADRYSQVREHEVFFDAWRTMFDGTGFARGTVSLMRASAGAKGGLPLLTLELEREQFEHHLMVIGGGKDPRDNYRVIRANGLLLNLFMTRCLEFARSSRPLVKGVTP